MNLAPYLTADAAQDRLLSRYKIKAVLNDGDMDAASDDLDSKGPWIGIRYAMDGTQVRAFPRSIEPDGSDGDGTVPENILDAVSFLALDYVEDAGPPVKSEGAMSANVTYATAKKPINTRRVDALIRRYQLTRGRLA